MEAGTVESRTRPRENGAGSLNRYTTETKGSTKTSEFWLTVAVVVGILISAAVIKGGDSGGTDEFIARNAWLFVAIVTAGYAISRGLAKSGAYEPYGVVEARQEVRDNAGK
jgi:hypothetical protein